MSDNRQEINSKMIGQGKLYRTLSSIAFIGVFIAMGIIVLSIMGTIPALNATLWGIVASFAIICLGIISTLPWIRRIEKNEFKKVSIIFVAFIAACAILWLICLWLIIAMILKEDPSSSLWFLLILQIAIVLSLQLMVATFVGNVLIKCGKTMIVVQVISYLSYLFVDFYLSFLVCSVVIDPTGANQVSLNETMASVITNFTVVTIFVLAVVYSLIANSIIKSIENRRVKAMTEEALLRNVQQNNQQLTQQNAPIAPQTETAEDKLAKLKDLYDKHLITEEEYNKKRNDILSQL